MAPEQLCIQQAGIADLPKIMEIYNSTIPGRMVTADLNPVSVEERIEWFHAHPPGKYPLLVVFEENEMVGWISFQPFYGRPAYDFTAELSIYLDQKFRGLGYGSYLLSEAINLGIDLHFKTLLGFIFGHNEPSLRLFYKSGFEQYACLPKIAILDGIERDLLILGKRIAK